MFLKLTQNRVNNPINIQCSFIIYNSTNATNSKKMIDDKLLNLLKTSVNEVFYQFLSLISIERPFSLKSNKLYPFLSQNMILKDDVSTLNNEDSLFISKYYQITMNNKQDINIINNIIFNDINIPYLIEFEFDINQNNYNNNMNYRTNMFKLIINELNESSLKLLYDENAGGNSEYSEAISFEIMNQIFENITNVKLLKTEMEIQYWLEHWKKTDYMIQFETINKNNKNNNKAIKIGVSVTRAMVTNDEIFTKYKANKLLIKKLIGINESTEGVLERDQWKRQILFIWSLNENITKILKKEWILLNYTNPELVSNTIVIICTIKTIKDTNIKNYYPFDWIFWQSKLKLENNESSLNMRCVAL